MDAHEGDGRAKSPFGSAGELRHPRGSREPGAVDLTTAGPPHADSHTPTGLPRG